LLATLDAHLIAILHAMQRQLAQHRGAAVETWDRDADAFAVAIARQPASDAMTGYCPVIKPWNLPASGLAAAWRHALT
jgi:hypothetical protein